MPYKDGVECMGRPRRRETTRDTTPLVRPCEKRMRGVSPPPAFVAVEPQVPKVDQVMREVKAESKAMPVMGLMVVALAAMAPGPPLWAICAEP